MKPDLSPYISHLPIGPVEFYETIGSTNDLAAVRLAAGSPDLTIITADEQTTGRGRHGRNWHTPPGAALAISIVLHTPAKSPPWAYAPLGALAVHSALIDLGLKPSIKWPNDVLLSEKKVCGILAEAHWQGGQMRGVVLGIGINILPEAVPAGRLPFPATSVAEAAGREVDRWKVFAGVIGHLLFWRSRIESPQFVADWEARLAFKGQRVQVGEHTGRLLGIDPEGSLLLETTSGIKTFPAGELSLRPAG